MSLMIITVLSKILGFCREVILAYFYGASDITDTYLMASSAAAVFFGWISTLSILHTPLYQSAKFKHSKEYAERFTNQLILIVSLTGVLCIWFASNFSYEIISFISSGFSNSQIEMTVIFFQWVVYSVVINAINQIWISEMNCKDRFVSAASTNLILSIVQMVIILFSGVLQNILLLRITQVSASIVQFLLLYFICKKGRFNKIRLPFVKEFRNMFVLTIPIFLSSFMDEINSFFDKSFGSMLKEGSISALNYAHLIKQLFFFIFVTSFITVIFPKISKDAAQENWPSFSKNITNSLNVIILLFVPITLFVVFFSKPIVSLIYLRGQFDLIALDMTSIALSMYGLALLPLAIREVLIKAFQALQSTKTCMYVGFISTLLNIILNFLLINVMGHAGLALSTAISAYATVPILYLLLIRKGFVKNFHKTILVLIKSSISASIAIFIVYIIYSGLSLSISSLFIQTLFMLIILVLLLILYIFMMYMLRVPEIHKLLLELKRRLL